MKYKSRTNPFYNKDIMKNTITTFNLKIKNIHILLDDITTNKLSRNSDEIKRSNSYQNNNDFIHKYSTKTYNNQNNAIYIRKNFPIKKIKKKKDKTVKSIPISFKKVESNKNTDTSPPSFLTTMEGFYSTNLTGLISERNNYNKKLYLDNTNCKDIRCKIDDLLDNNKVYIRKINNSKSKCNLRKNNNKHSNTPIIFRTKAINNKRNKNKFILKSKTLNLKYGLEAKIQEPRIVNKKIKFDFNHDKTKETKNSLNGINSLSNNSVFWKNVILIQKVFRNFIKKKKFNDKYQILSIKIPNYKNYHCIHFVSKLCYKNNIGNIILIQKYFKKFLSKIHSYNFFNIYTKKPEIKPCFITKENNRKVSLINSKSISFKKKKISTLSKKKKNNLKFKSLIKNYNLFSYNYTTKSYNLKSEENSFQNINNSEIHEYNNNEIINKLTNEIINQNEIINNKKNKIRGLFVRNILQKVNSIIFQSGYNYKSLLNFINSIYLIFIKYKLNLFFKHLSYFNTKKEIFIKSIFRHINIYKRNNFIKNEIIHLIENNLPEGIKLENFDSRFPKFTSEQENNLINTQILKEDNNLVNYIYLFFKYEKNKKVNFKFIENRLIKEPLNYRNIFTVLRYIDNLDAKINTNKICTNCFCKKNESVCSLNCNCHFLVNIIYMNSLDFKKKKIKRDLKTYQYVEENIENNPNILNIEPKININLIKSNVEKNIKNELKNNFIRDMHINDTFHYFNK